MKLNNFKSVYADAHTLYGVTLNPGDFEDIALNGWSLIGNKQTKLYKYTTHTVNQRIQIPCNVDFIEAVFSSDIESQSSTQLTSTPDLYNQYVESYIEAWKKDSSVFYNSGKLVKYRQEGDELVFNRDYNNITILYHGIIADEEGLPYLTDKEVRALAVYCAYVEAYKKGIMLRDATSIQIAQTLELKWRQLCNAARLPEHFTQNEMNDIADVQTRWDRKLYGRSFKPIL